MKLTIYQTMNYEQYYKRDYGVNSEQDYEITMYHTMNRTMNLTINQTMEKKTKQTMKQTLNKTMNSL